MTKLADIKKKYQDIVNGIRNYGVGETEMSRSAEMNVKLCEALEKCIEQRNEASGCYGDHPELMEYDKELLAILEK